VRLQQGVRLQAGKAAYTEHEAARALHGVSFETALVAHTVEEEDGEEKIRIISARKTAPRERPLYDTHH
jgi:uncharacterized DUF497 family protein